VGIIVIIMNRLRLLRSAAMYSYEDHQKRLHKACNQYNSVKLTDPPSPTDDYAAQSSGYSSRMLLTNKCASLSQRLKWRPASRKIASEGSVLGETGSMFSSAT
jgi:hypothetical protein